MKKLLLLPAVIFLFIRLSAQTVAYDSIDINNINARINANGNLFWDLINKAEFKVPKGTGKTSIFNSTLWLAGLDSLDTLHAAAERLEQIGHDFWPGPISNVYDSTYDAKWNKVWKIRKSDIDYHLAHCWQTGYIPAQVLLDWPANGDTTMGQQKITAPFYDWNHDGIYNPYAGDYPLIKGDEAIYFIFNDDRFPHTESLGNKIGIEVHGMAYEFDCSEDSALWNTLFLNYKIFNNSNILLYNSYIGIWTDFDIGDAFSDYVGCDVQRGSYYGYNGDDIDGTGKPQDYGMFPPAQSVTVLAGPYIDPDGNDNPIGLCDEGINGFNFNNNIIDDERMGLRRFVYHNNDVSVMGDPVIAIDYYNYLQGYWKDTTKMQWGGNAHAPGPGVCGPECDFMFPGDSDTCRWGTQGIVPYCTSYWAEETVGNTPYDRRGLGSMGPFTFEPGDIQEVDIAFVFGRDYVDSTAAAGVAVMQQRIDSIIKYFRNDTTPCGLSFSGLIPQQRLYPQVNIYPNPARDYVTVETSGITGSIDVEIFNIIGEKTYKKKMNSSSKETVNISHLKPGLYFIKVYNGEYSISKKVIKL